MSCNQSIIQEIYDDKDTLPVDIINRLIYFKRNICYVQKLPCELLSKILQYVIFPNECEKWKIMNYYGDIPCWVVLQGYERLVMTLCGNTDNLMYVYKEIFGITYHETRLCLKNAIFLEKKIIDITSNIYYNVIDKIQRENPKYDCALVAKNKQNYKSCTFLDSVTMDDDIDMGVLIGYINNKSFPKEVLLTVVKASSNLELNFHKAILVKDSGGKNLRSPFNKTDSISVHTDCKRKVWLVDKEHFRTNYIYIA